jgi:uncharacterized membrane protein
MEQSRWKSPVAWSALAALLFFVVKTWFGFEIPGWDQFVTLVIAAGVAFGIFNNPTNKAGY